MNLSKFVGLKIKHYRNEKGYTQEELAKKIGVGKTTIANYESGYRSANQDTLFKLADIFEVSIDEFFPDRNDDRFSSDADKFVTPVKIRKEEDLIPIVGRIAAGTPNFIVEDDIIGYMSLPPGKESSEGLIYLEVTSDSMDRKFPIGSYVLLDTQASLENGDIAAIKINGEEATLKQVKFEENNKSIMLIPQSHNSNYYPVTLDIEEQEVNIVGKAVGMYLSI